MDEVALVACLGSVSSRTLWATNAIVRGNNMIHYLIGDATQPKEVSGSIIIAHCCNDIGKWGSGFVVAVSKVFPEAEEAYREMVAYRLGQVQFVSVGMSMPFQKRYIIVANMIGQHGVRSRDNPKPVRYDAVRECLKKVAAKAVACKASVVMPRICSGLAGGTWPEVEPIIQDELKDVEVYVYDLPEA